MTRSARRAVRGISRWILLVAILPPFLLSTHRFAYGQPDCDTGVVLGGHDHTAVDAGGPTGTPDHCVICHWLRTMANASPAAAPTALPGFVVAESVVRVQLLARRDAPRGSRASRAPPALHLL